jgi:cell division transport system permease protein
MSKSPAQHQRSLKGAKPTKISWSQHFLNYFLAHFSAAKLSYRNLALHPLASLLTVFAIGICLSLPISLYLLIKNVQDLGQRWDPDCAVTLYLEPKATSSQINTLVEKIKEYSFIKSYYYQNPDQALQEFEKNSGFKDILTLLPENPLPGIISLQLDSKITTPQLLHEFKESFSKMPAVKEVDFDFAWVEKLNTVLSFGKMLVQFLYLTIGIGVIFIIGNTIRLALEHHRDEIQVLNLVGATRAFIRRPFLYRGMLYGGFGGMVAILMIYVLFYALNPLVQQIANLFNNTFSLKNLEFYDTIFLLLSSAGLGWLGASMAFTQQNKQFISESTL